MSLGILKKFDETDCGKVSLWITHRDGYTWVYDSKGDYFIYSYEETGYGERLKKHVEEGAPYKLVAPECLGVW